MWLCGYVAMWLSFQFSNFQMFNFQMSKLPIFIFPKITFPYINCPSFKNQISNFKICKMLDSQFSKGLVRRLSNIFKKSDSHIYKHNVFQKCFLFFLYFVKYLGRFKSINKGSPGLTNPEIMETLGFGPSHNKIEVLLDQN